MSIPYYMIANLGTLQHSELVWRYPYHLVLAQLCVQSPAYQQLAQDLGASCRRLILDNGAHEGALVTDEQYLEVLQSVKPDCVVLPDLIGRDHRESRERSLDFLVRCGAAHYTGDFIYAPQGADQDQIRREFHWAQRRFEGDERVSLGFGQSYLTWEDAYSRDERARFQLMDEVLSMPRARLVSYHILGARWSPLPLTRWQKFDIRGLDSVKPCSCAVNSVSYPTKPNNKLNLLDVYFPNDVRLLQECLRFCRAYDLRFSLNDPWQME